MRYYWLLDNEAQEQFKIQYQPGQENLGNYHTKLFSGKDTQKSTTILRA